ncbi:MAG: PEP-CTERM sorting domain-containing protein [Verrucomicrobiota bacterium]
MMSKYFPLLAACALSSSVAYGASTSVSIDSGTSTIRDNQNVLLSAGLSGDGDGAVIQIGYYSQATAANNFAGTWIPLSGNESANTGGVVVGSSPAQTFNTTSIGDTNANSNGNGTFAFTLSFVQGDAGTGNNLPGSTSIPLSIRFYNKATVAESSFFNVVSDDLWLWQTPAEAPSSPLMELTLLDPNLEWLGGAGSEFMTTIAIPEPGSATLLLAGITGLALRRRRSS